MLPTLVMIVLFARSAPAQTVGGTDSDSSKKSSADTAAFVMQKSPLGAVVRSAIIPGWGQLYNRSYWKIPLVLGLTGFLAYGIVTEHNSFLDYRDRYAATVTLSNPTGNLVLKQFREFYRNNRDTYGWWFLITYLIQIADAFVDAHLYDFDISDEVHAMLHVSPVGRLTASIHW